MKAKYLYCIACAVISSLMWSILLSCENKETPVAPYFTLLMNDGKDNALGKTWQVSQEEQTQSLVIKSNKTWEIKIPGTEKIWVSVNPDQGENDGQITLNIAENTTLEQREAKIDFVVDHNLVYGSLTVRQSASGAPELPVADILNVVFSVDGTAEDISPMHNTLTVYPATTLLTVFNDTYQRYVARFHNTAGQATSAGYYRMSYSGNNTIKNGLADGHTLEALFTVSRLADAEMKVLSSMEGGGTGLMLGTDHNIIYLPHIGSGYVWNRSGIIPELGRYYHVVGVYDKQAGKTYVYVDGVLKASNNVSGNFNFPGDASYHWFGIGVDAGVPAQSSWQGDVAIARIYNKPLSAGEVTDLYDQVKNKPAVQTIRITDISYFSGIKVVRGGKYIIHGAGYNQGDKIKFSPLSGSGNVYTCDGEVSVSNIKVTLPSQFAGGTYRIAVVRGEESYDLGNTTLTVVDDPSAIIVPKIICHRGFWNTAGSAQNSIASLQKAQELGAYGAECDIWLTSDGVAVMNHDGVIDGLNIETNTYAAIKDKTLSNGEKIPTLEAYLAKGKENTQTKLILEIKTHSNRANNNAVVDEVIRLVGMAGMENDVEYIAFDWDNCRRIINQLPNATVGYLNGDKTPQQVFDEHINIMDYEMSVWRNHNNYVQTAHDLGIGLNVWTVNTVPDMQYFMSLGVDFITTDYPLELKQLLDEYAEMMH
jgi:glycerophosphoryl diester phosphodiesterase